MNCDRIAPFYQWIEKAAFGGKLQRHRTTYLSAARGKRRVLIIGDGDGRFMAALTKAYPELSIDCLEISPGMILEARRRVKESASVRILCQDATTYHFDRYYDAVFTHFFLDCFPTESAAALVRRISEVLTNEAVWVVSEFREECSGWRRMFTRAWLTAMYAFFYLATGLQTRRMPAYSAAMEAAGFTKEKEQTSMGGLIASECWQR